MANLEGLWVSGRVSPGKTVVASDQAHYTHRRISEVLQLPFESIPTDRSGRMDVSALRDVLGAGTIGTVVATIGTTGTGAVDPLVEILELQKQYGFRVHADAAYGGYYLLADNLRGDTRRSLQALAVVDSVAIDPHKHGLQPYGCGCILHRDPSVGTLYKHDSPYTYFTSSELHLGEISLECSRAGAAAVALWATQKLLPLVHGGQFARDLGHCRQAALSLAAHIRQDERFILLTDPELDIVVWAPRAKSANEITERSRALFAETAKHHLHLALMTVPSSRFLEAEPTLDGDRDSVVCLRSCLMKPEHDDWIKSIWRILDRSMNEILGVASP